MRRDAGPGAALANRFAKAHEIGGLQIAKAAVQRAVVIEGGAAAEVVAIDQGDAQPARGGIPGGHQPADAAADHEQIEGAGAERLQVASHSAAGSRIESRHLHYSYSSCHRATVRRARADRARAGLLERAHSRSGDHDASVRLPRILSGSRRIPFRQAASSADADSLRGARRQARARCRVRHRRRSGAICAGRRRVVGVDLAESADSAGAAERRDISGCAPDWSSPTASGCRFRTISSTYVFAHGVVQYTANGEE